MKRFLMAKLVRVRKKVKEEEVEVYFVRLIICETYTYTHRNPIHQTRQ